MAIIVHRWICFTILPYIIFLSDHQVLIFLFLSDGHVLFEATNPTIMVVAQHTSPTFSWNQYCTSNVGSGFGSCKISKRGYTISQMVQVCFLLSWIMSLIHGISSLSATWTQFPWYCSWISIFLRPWYAGGREWWHGFFRVSLTF